MRSVFADAFYWISLANPCDQWHDKVKRVSESLGAIRIVTTDEVLVEFLTFFSRLGSHWRQKAVHFARSVFADPSILVLPQTRDSFQSGLRLYEHRPDKDYSLTDCISMETMQRHSLTEALTNDRHFAQEGFRILLEG